jgi:acyl-CoA dehydrogenase
MEAEVIAIGRHPGAQPASGGAFSAAEDKPFWARVDAVKVVAAAEADAVDRHSLFPAASVQALRGQRLLGITVPRALGGEAARVTDVVEICYQLGQACASTAMIYAMHQSCVACVSRHGQGHEWHDDLLRRIAGEQWLVASSTTEGQGGGNVRSSAAPLEHDGAAIRLDRAATVISYGAEADALITTARRHADAARSDQVLVAFRRGDYTLDQLGGWDALGMRGTCSAGFRLQANGRQEQVLPVPYETIHQASMVPVSHLTWSAVWAGIAADAVERARAFTRRAARLGGGALPPGAGHFAEAGVQLRALLGLIAASVRAYEDRAADQRALAASDFQAEMSSLKVQASESAVAIVLAAARACGLAGYRNDSEFSVARHVRDVLSSPIMINNDRIMANLATTSLLSEVPASVCR